jgi:rubrerythrin
MTVKERAVRRVRNYHCKVCGEYYARRLPNCPVCKARKGAPLSRPSFKYVP